jgi:regulator of replication initiation timing
MAFDGQQYDQHPLSAAYPAMAADDFTALRADIKRNGLREPINLFERQVLDGWHRYTACLLENVSPMFVEFDEGDPRDFVISKNGHRRHLTEVQRARAIVAVAAWAPAGKPKPGSAAGFSAPMTSAQMAQAAQVSERTIRNVKAGEKAGLGEAMRDGKVSAEKAAEIAKAPPKVQAAAKVAIAKGEAPALPTKLSESEKLQIENGELRERLAEMARDLEVYLKIEEADGNTDNVVKTLMEKNRVVETQRDTLLRENAELKKEIKGLRRKLGLKA